MDITPRQRIRGGCREPAGSNPAIVRAWCPVDITVAPRYSYHMKRWTTEEVEFMVANHDTLTIQELATALSRTKRAVEDYRLRNRITMSSETQRAKSVRGAATARGARNGMFGADNPNWKGDRSKNHYFYKLRQMARYPERAAAGRAVAREVRSGRMKRRPCEVCGDQNSHAHHNDYSKPLDVVWLCRAHHRERHCS